jgi:acyl-CoA synthetase (NDP forming)
MLWLAESPEVKVIVGYIEAIRDGAAFVQALAAARRQRKPVVMIKVGRSNAGALAAASHTGALVGQDDVYDALLRQYGVHRADSIEQLVDIARVCARGVLPADRSIGIVTLSGGLGVQAADAAERNGLEVRPFPAAGQAKIKSLISFAGTANPIDVTAQATNEATLTGRCIDIALTEGGYQSLVCLLSTIPAAPKFADPILQSLVELRARYPERLIVLAFAAPPDVVWRFEDAGFPVFEDQDAAIHAIAALAAFGENFRAAPAEETAAASAVTLPATLDEHTAKAVLAQAGIPVLVEHLVRDGAAARRAATEIGGPVVLKIVSPDIAHKTEIGGVVLDVRTPEDAERETVAMLERIAQRAPQARVSGVLVSPMLGRGVETICGSFTDPVFGPIVMFGLGGIHVEVLRDVAFRLAPFSEREALAMISQIRGHKLLQGVRGAPPSDLAALARTLSRLSQFAVAQRGTVAEIDINPLLVLQQGQGVYALDALIVPHPASQETSA